MPGNHRHVELAVVQVRAGRRPPPWWPSVKVGARKVERSWVTVDDDGSGGWALGLDESKATAPGEVASLKRSWVREHGKGDWQWRIWTRRDG